MKATITTRDYDHRGQTATLKYTYPFGKSWTENTKVVSIMPSMRPGFELVMFANGTEILQPAK